MQPSQSTPEQIAWKNMKARCFSRTHPAYHHYGGRGITVYPPWMHDFAAFFAYIGPRPSPCHSLDRYPDNDGNYEPGNVRWATKREQILNSHQARLLTHQGRTLPLVTWAEILGMPLITLRNRLDKWGSVERAFTEPSKTPRPTRPTHCPKGHAYPKYHLHQWGQRALPCPTCNLATRARAKQDI